MLGFKFLYGSSQTLETKYLHSNLQLKKQFKQSTIIIHVFPPSDVIGNFR